MSSLGCAAAQAAQEAAAAERTLAAERDRIAQERAGLERQLLQLQGDTTALRALDRAALDASNRALFDQITALQDSQAAAAAAAQAQRDYTAAVEAAQAAVERARSAVASAESGVAAVREQANNRARLPHCRYRSALRYGAWRRGHVVEFDLGGYDYVWRVGV